MNAKLFLNGNGSGGIPKAVILYDHLDTLLAANQLVNRGTLRTGEDREWVVNSWKFDMLSMGFKLEAYRALEDSADAALMLVAIRDPKATDALPVIWLEHWALRRFHRNARLVVLPFDRSGKCVAFALFSDGLRRMAESHGLLFSVFNEAADNTVATQISDIVANEGASPFRKAFTECNTAV